MSDFSVKRLIALGIITAMVTEAAVDAGSFAYASDYSEEEITFVGSTEGEEVPEETQEEQLTSSSGESLDESIPVVTYVEEEVELPEDYYTEYPTGLLEGYEPEEVESVSEKGYKRGFLRSSFGSEYEAKHITENLPPLRDQSPYGTCWAFATTALAEIYAMNHGLTDLADFSELHLAYFTYNTVTDPLGGTAGDDTIKGPGKAVLNDGGRIEHGLRSFDRWMGVADENLAAYDRDDLAVINSGLSANRAFEDVIHVSGYYEEPFEKDHAQIATKLHSNIKQLILDYGAVAIEFYAYNSMSSSTDDKVYKVSTNAYYNPENKIANHAVVIVGWDDDFPASNFATEAPGDGAFLVRNSWKVGDGSSVEDNYSYSGYFWMSYYEATIGTTVYAAEFEPSDYYDNNYEYDGAIRVVGSGYSKGANVFTAHASGGDYGEIIRGVSFYTPASNVHYSIDVYTDLTDLSNPESGSKLFEEPVTGDTTYAGYYTVELFNDTAIASGATFSIVVSLEKPGNYTPSIGMESYYSNMGTSEAREGESFVYKDDSWQDNSVVNYSRNLAIKAYTDNCASPQVFYPTSIELPEIEDDTLTIGIGESVKVTANVLPTYAVNKEVTWSSQNNNIATVDANGIIVGVATGSATITVSTNNGELTRSFLVQVQKKLLGLYIGRSVLSTRVGETYVINYYTDPSDYVLKETPVWSTTTPDKVSVEAGAGSSATMTVLAPGKMNITVSAEGVRGMAEINAFPAVSSYGYEVEDDNTVIIRWDAIPNATRYELKRGETTIYSAYPDDRDSYSYTDTYYQENDSVTEAKYTFLYLLDSTYYSLTINVDFSPRYPINYVVGAGTQSSSNPQKYTAGKNTTLYEPTPPEGYSFVGWYLNPSFTAVSKRASIYSTDTGELTLYAKYEKLRYQVTFEKGNGEYSLVSQVWYGDKVAVPVAPKRAEYTFAGWYTDESFATPYDFDSVVSSHFTLYARWIPQISGILLKRVMDDGSEIKCPSVIDIGDNNSVTLKAQVLPEGYSAEEMDYGYSWKNYGNAASPIYAYVRPSSAATATVNEDGTLTITANSMGTVTVTAISDADPSFTVAQSFEIKNTLPQSMLIEAEGVSNIEEGDDLGIYLEGEESLKGSIILTTSLYNDKNMASRSEADKLGAFCKNQEVEFWSSDESVVVVSFTGETSADANGNKHYYAFVEPADGYTLPEGQSYATARISAVSTRNNAVYAEYDVVLKEPSYEGDVNLNELQIISTDRIPVVYASNKAETDIDTTGVVLATGRGKSVKARFLPDIKDKTISWESANPAVATVSAAGAITAKSAGDVVITATSNALGISASMRVTVYDPVTTFTIDKTALKLGRGQQYGLQVMSILPVSASDVVTYSSSKPNIATVDEHTGLITAVSNGSAVITAKTAFGERTAKCTVTVGNAVEAIEVKAAGNAKDLMAGRNLQLQMVFNDNIRTNQPVNKDVVWEIVDSSDTDVATVSARGAVTAKKEGWVKVVARSTTDIDSQTGDYVTSNEYLIRIYVPVKKAVLNKTAVTISQAKSYELEAQITPAIDGETVTGQIIEAENGAISFTDLSHEITWSLKNAADAAYVQLHAEAGEDGSRTKCRVEVLPEVPVNKRIVVTATFTPYTANGAKPKATVLSCTVTVSNGALTRLAVTPAALNMNRGGEGVLTASLTPMVPAESGIKWSIADDGVSRDLIQLLDENGTVISEDYCGDTVRVKAIAQSGVTKKTKAVVIATTVGTNASGKNLTSKINVNIGNEANEIVLMQGRNNVTWDDGSESGNDGKLLSIAVGKSVSVKATVYSVYDALVARNCVTSGNQKVIWESSDPSVATVSAAGAIKAVSPGVAEIYARSAETYHYHGTELCKAESKVKVYVYQAATKIALDKAKSAIALPVDSASTQKSSLRQYDVISATVTADTFFDNVVLASSEGYGAGDAAKTLDKNVITWTVDNGAYGKELIAVAAVDTDVVRSAADGYNKQQLLYNYDNEFVPLHKAVVNDTSDGRSSFTTGRGESLAIKALRAGTVRLTAAVPDGRKIVCTVTVNTHVSDIGLKLTWVPGVNGNAGSYSGPIQRTITINREKKTVNVLEASETPGRYVARLDLRNNRTVTLAPALDYVAGRYLIENGIYGDEIAVFSDKRTNDAEKANTTLYNDVKRFAINNVVYYRSSNPSVATVAANGAITAKGLGTATITISTADGSIQKKVTVNVRASAADWVE